MYKIILLILMMTSAAFAQITLEHTYTNGQVYYIKLKNSGEKYYVFEKGNTSYIKIYNMDHSVFKTITIPVAYDGYTPNSAYHVTEGLFTADNNVGALVVYTNSSSTYKARVIVDGSSNPLLEVANCNYGSAVQTANGAKLITNEYVVSGSTVLYSSHVYALPGSLPAAMADGGNLPERIQLGQSYPNPVNGAITIPYEIPAGVNEATLIVYNLLGQEVLNFRVDNNFHDLQLSSDRLSAGTYIYQLRTPAGLSEAKRFTVTK